MPKPILALLVLSCFAIPSTNMSAQTAPIETTLDSHRVNRIQMTNTPLVDALNLIEGPGRVEILIDRAAIDAADISLYSPVTASIENASVEDILQQILPTDLGTTRQKQSIVVSTRQKIDSGVDIQIRPHGSDFRPVRVATLAANTALGQRIPVHFEQAPLHAVVRMLGGFAGKQVVFDTSARVQSGQFVSIHRDQATIRENMDELMEAAGLKWEIGQQAIIVSAKTE